MLTLALLAAQSLAVVGGPELPDPGKVGMTREQQIQLGFQAASQVYQQMPVLPDSSPETQYIRQLGQRLEATIPPQYSWPFEFHVIAQKEINAFALPGGPMFVNVGTIIAADNEAELAGVMAHEMSHVYMQHSAKQAGKAELTAGLAGLAGALLGATLGGGLVGQLAQAGIQFGAQGIILKYSRTDEAQADEVGAIILGDIPLAANGQATRPKVRSKGERAMGHRAARGNAANVQPPRIEAVGFCNATHRGDEES